MRGGFSTWDSDAMWSDSRLTIQPEIRVNQAVRVHGVYTVGGYRNKYFQHGGMYDYRVMATAGVLLPAFTELYSCIRRWRSPV